MQKPVCFLNIFSDLSVYMEFIVDQHLDYISYQARFGFEALDFSDVRISEMSSTQVEPRSLGHLIDDSLNESLLLENITCVLEALQIRFHKLPFLLLIQILKFQGFFEDFQPIDSGIYVLEIFV